MPLNNPFKPNAGHGLLYSDELTIKVNEAETFDWTGEHTFENNVYSQTIQPRLTDTYDLGTPTKLWRKGYLSELDATLFAKETISLLGGWLMVPKDAGTLAADVLSTDTSIDFGKAMTTGHFVVMRAALKVEYVQVGTLVSGTRYNVTRDLDGTGANDWPAGTPFAVLGTTGDGRIELNAYDTPRISLLNQGAAYNTQTEMLRIGDLNGNWGYASQTWGVAIGEYLAGKPNITIDPTNGLRFRIHNTNILTFDSTARMTGVLNIDTNGGIFQGTGSFASPTTALKIYNSGGVGLLEMWGGGTKQVYFGTDGKLNAGAGKVTLDSTGIRIIGSTTWENARSYQLDDGSGGYLGGMGGYVYSTAWPHNAVTVKALYTDAGYDNAFLSLQALGNSSAGTPGEARVDITASGYYGSCQVFLQANSISREINLTSDIVAITGELSHAASRTTACDVIRSSQTWDNAAAVFRGIRLNVTNTASHADSRLLDLQVGGTSKFSVDPDGRWLSAGLRFCRLRRSTSQSIPNNQETAITFDQESWDYGDMHSTTSNTSRLVFPVAGIYYIFAQVVWGTNTNGYRRVVIKLNGSTTFAEDRRDPVSQHQTVQNISTAMRCAANDYAELVAYQNSGGNLNVDSWSMNGPTLGAVYLGDVL